MAAGLAEHPYGLGWIVDMVEARAPKPVLKLRHHQLRVCVDTVGKWRSRFLEQRLDGLLDQPRSGRPRMIDDADVERVIALTLETTPKDATHWSTRSMARLSGATTP